MILTCKRNRKEEICNSALGIIAYVKSFRGICDAELVDNKAYIERKHKLRPDLNDILLRESIIASQDTLRNKQQEKIRKSDKLTNMMLAILTTVLSVIGILQITEITYGKSDISVFYIFLSWVVLTQPLICLISLGLISFFFAERWGIVSFKPRPNLYRVIVTQDQRPMERALNMLGLIIAVVTILLIAYMDEIVASFLLLLNHFSICSP